MIPIAHPYVPPSAIDFVQAVMTSKWIGQGPRVDQFESAFAERFGLRPQNCVAVNSGTSALELAYDLAGIGEGDTVITTALTCTATNIPLVRRGARLLFADIDPDTLVLTDETIEQADPEHKAKAIVAVHLHGIPCMLSDTRPIIADAAQALGEFGGDFVANSFQAIKHVTTGDGGMLFCSAALDADKARLLRWFGIDRTKKLENNWQAYKNRKILFDIELAGYKYQMTDIAAAMGIAGLAEYDQILQHRELVFDVYKQHGLPMVDAPGNRYGYACLLAPDRDRFAARMTEAGIETNIMHVRNDAYSLFAPFRRHLPNLDAIEDHYICIPLHNCLKFPDVVKIAETAAKSL